MSLSNQNVKNIYIANGVQVNFAPTFQFVDNSQVEVYTMDKTDPLSPIVSQKVNVTDFTFNANPATLVQFLVAPANGLEVILARKTALTQEFDLLDSQVPLNSETEVNLDRVVMMVQELYHRAVLLPKYYDSATPLGPLGNPIPDALLGTDSSGTNFKFVDVAVLLGGGYVVSTLGAALNNGDVITSSVSDRRTLVRVVGNGHVTLDATTPLSAGSFDGQEVLLTGQDDANTVTILSTSANMDMNGDIALGKNDMLELVWITADSKWVEKSRRT